MLTLRSKLQSFLFWLVGDSDDYTNPRAFWAEQVREAVRDRTPDDHYSKRYQREVRRRIISGHKPRKPLVQTRLALASFAEEVLKRRGK